MLKRTMNTILTSFFLVFFLLQVGLGSAQGQTGKAQWIWYPGDWEIWLGNQVQTRRTEKNVFIPPFWQLYNFSPCVNFGKKFDLAQSEEIYVKAEGRYNVTIDGNYVNAAVDKILLPAGKHRINFQVYNDKTPPTVFVQGKSIVSDASWTAVLIHNNSPHNIPSENEILAGTYSTFIDPASPPSKYKLATRPMESLSVEKGNNSWLVDFGKETFGFLKFSNLKGTGRLSLYYGESKEEALSLEHCETFDHINIDENTQTDFTTSHARAFRYVNIKFDPGITFSSISGLYEFLDVPHRGKFKSSDEQINKIWNVAEYTLELNSREFFFDGIKRDRWVWSGDAVQSYLMNYYLFFDNDAVKRTTWTLRGADPVNAHINTILDYSLYWFTGIYDYYNYSGDKEFLKSVYPRMITLMDFVLSRRNSNGMIEGLPGDWVFLDWAPMTKEGELSSIQLLFIRSLEAMSICAELMNDTTKAKEYNSLAANLKQQVMQIFWDKDRGALVHSRNGGELNRKVTRYPNMFAMMFGYLNEEQVAQVKRNVLANDTVQKITTPYMRFYELAALAEVGEHKYVTKAIRDYWGGMLNEGATSFWEVYDPKEKGADRYAMYGRPFGRSLCHAWGASPLYLLGKYYLGVKPLAPGYSEYVVEPQLGGLQWIDGVVPTPNGDISVYANEKKITVKSATKGKGVLRFRSAKRPTIKGAQVTHITKVKYELILEPGTQYEVGYSIVK